MASQGQGGDRRFTPFNFSDVKPFDSFAAVLAEIPTLHVSEPAAQASGIAEDELPTTIPSRTEQAEMLEILCEAASEGDWRNLAYDEPRRRSHQSGQHPTVPSWINSFDSQLTLKLNHLEKRPPSPRRPNPRRSTPKRPRHVSPVVSISSDSEDAKFVASTPPRTPPERKPQSPMQRTSLTPQDVHYRELQMQQLSKDVDLDDFREFVDYIQRFIRRLDSYKANGMDSEDAILKVTSNASLMSELRQKVVLAVDQASIPHIMPNLLKQLVSILETRIHEASRKCSVVDEMPGTKNAALEGTLGLVAAQVVLSIISAPNSPRFLLVEERLESIISLLRNISMNLVYPAYDSIYHASKSVNGQQKAQGARSSRKQRAGDSIDDGRNGGTERIAKPTRRAVTKKDEALHDSCCALLDALTTLFRKEHHLPDSVVSHCTSLCIQSFSVTSITRMQLHCVKTLCAIFSSYTAHRLSILDEVREALSWVPANRRHLRCFPISGEGREVRVTSALLAQLLCIASTDEEDVELHSEASPSATRAFAWSMLRRKRHDRAAKLAAHVLEPLLNRAYSDREPEYRAAFQALFEDILILYGRPEWPSAELMLQTMSVSIITKMRTNEDKSVFLKSIAVDILGSLAAKMCEFYGNEILHQQTGQACSPERDEVLEGEREVLILFLEAPSSLHLSAAKCFYEALFVTDDLSIAFMQRERSKKIAAAQAKELPETEELLDGQDTALESDDEIYSRVEKTALQRAERVSLRQSRREQIDSARASDAARHIGMKRSFAGGFRTILDTILEGMHDAAPTVRAKSIKALSVIDEACRGLVKAFPILLKYIEAGCRDVSTLARDAALDLLSRSLEPEDVPDAAAGGTGRHGNGKTDYEGNRDQREGELFEKVFTIVERRLLDTSTSVRKRAIAIMRSVMSNALQRAEFSRQGQMKAIGASDETMRYEARIVQICISVVARLDDPEASVREAGERTVRLGLFGFDVSQQLPRGLAQNRDSITIVAERLVTVFSRLRSSMHSSFLSRLVHKDMRVKHKSLLASIVNAVVEQFHEYEAKIANTSGGRSFKELSSSELQAVKLYTAHRVACSSVICAFAALDASLVTPHCRALAPSLKGISDGNPSESDLLCVQRILKILELGLGRLNDIDVSFLEEVMHDVDIIICQSPLGALEEASVRCLCVIARKAGTSAARDLLRRAADLFNSYLQDCKENLREYCNTQMPPKVTGLERNARGALVRLGLLTRYADFDNDFVASVYATLESTCHIVCIRNVRDILAKAAIRALSHLLIRHRSMLTRGTQLFLHIMEASRNVESTPVDSLESTETNGVATFAEGLQLCVFQGFNELLRDEEERNSAVKENDGHIVRACEGDDQKTMGLDGQIDSNKDGLEDSPQGLSPAKPVLAAEEDAEAGFLALSAQSMIPMVQLAVQSQAVQVRRTVTNILGLIVRQGLVLPATVVPSLFSLLLDQDPRCRDCSYRVISFLSDRHSDMLASATTRALRVCFEPSFFVRYASVPILHNDIENTKDTQGKEMRSWSAITKFRCATADEISALSVDERNGQSLLSPAIMSMRRDQRRGVLESLIREFDPRASTRIASPTANSNDTRVQDEYVENGGGQIIDIDAPNGNGLQADSEIRNFDHADDDEDDDDIGDVSGAELDLLVAEKLCPVPILYFVATTLATVDYSNGAGVGGSLTQGGGTAAADTKLKHAKEDVTELVGIATRIISNSGQATLRVAKQVMKQNSPRLDKKLKAALCACRMSLLLSLKNHLKVVRWQPVIEIDGSNKEELEMAAPACKMPVFAPNSTSLELAAAEGNDDRMLELADQQLELFERLMREDAIDESDIAAPSRRWSRVGASGRRKGSNRTASGKRSRLKVTAQVTSIPRRERLQRRASAPHATKKLRYDEESDDDGSDFDPKNI